MKHIITVLAFMCAVCLETVALAAEFGLLLVNKTKQKAPYLLAFGWNLAGVMYRLGLLSCRIVLWAAEVIAAAYDCLWLTYHNRRYVKRNRIWAMATEVVEKPFVRAIIVNYTPTWEVCEW